GPGRQPVLRSGSSQLLDGIERGTAYPSRTRRTAVRTTTRFREKTSPAEAGPFTDSEAPSYPRDVRVVFEHIDVLVGQLAIIRLRHGSIVDAGAVRIAGQRLLGCRIVRVAFVLHGSPPTRPPVASWHSNDAGGKGGARQSDSWSPLLPQGDGFGCWLAIARVNLRPPSGSRQPHRLPRADDRPEADAHCLPCPVRSRSSPACPTVSAQKTDDQRRSRPVQTHPDDAAILEAQARASGSADVLPHGRLLRVVLRG